MENNDIQTINDLAQLAKNHIQNNFVAGTHHVSVALKTKTRTYLALHLDTKGFDVCAEPIAVSNALANNDKEFEYIVASVLNADKSASIISPCGNCRQILLEHTPRLKVIVEVEGELVTRTPAELLPYPY